MDLSVIAGILIPFIVISLGAAFVFFMKKNLSRSVQRVDRLYYPLLNTTAGTNHSIQVQVVASNETKGYYSKINSLVYK